MLATFLTLAVLVALPIILVYIARAIDFLHYSNSSPVKVDYSSSYNNYDYKVARDSAGRRISTVFTFTPPLPKPPKATFFGKLDGKEFSIETPAEEKYTDSKGIHL